MSTNSLKTRVRLRSCSKTYPDGTKAVEDTNLDIAGGETVVLLGPSGCGKTTTLRMIAGLESADEGSQILFDDEDVTKLPIESRNIGMVFQSYALFPNMNVEKNIGYGLKVKKVLSNDIKDRVDEMLEMMDLTKFRTRDISQLSGGQRQRVALARAIAPRPRILLLDEPLTALDAILRERLREDISNLLKKLEITSIYVTHDREEGMVLGDKIVIMSHGKVEQIGTPREIYHQPANEHVASFIGNLNSFVGEIRGSKFVTEGGQLSINQDTNIIDNVLYCRPEDIVITSPDKAELTGIIDNIFFLGSFHRLIISGIGGSLITVDSHSNDVYTNGQQVGLALEPGSLMRLR